MIEFDVLRKTILDNTNIEVVTKKRQREIVDQKKIFCKIAYEHIKSNFSMIARYLETDHASVMSNYKKSKDHIKFDKYFRESYEKTKQDFLAKEKLIDAKKIKREIKKTKKYLKLLKKELKKFENKNNN